MKLKTKARRASKKPTISRFGVRVVVVCVLAGAPAAAAKTWTLEAAEAHLLVNSQFEALADASAAREEAAGRAALPWSNPFIGYQREQSFGATSNGAGGANVSGTAEDYLWVGQTFDFSFRRGLLSDAGTRRAAAAKLRAEAQRRDAFLRFEHLYFRALASAERQEIHHRWVLRLEELAARTRAREAAGDASRYDVLRIEREIVLAQQRRAQMEIHQSAVRAELAAWLDDDEATIQLEGALRPGPAPAAATPADRPLRAQALDEERHALTLEEAAAGRWYLPPVTATAGGKTVLSHIGTSPQTGELGYLVTVQVPIPALERGGARRDELAAAKRVAEAEAAMETHHVHKRRAAARAVWARALTALDAQGKSTLEGAPSLVNTARAAWSGGELSLLALLEAERATLDDELVAIDLCIAARNAQLAHAALTITEEPL